MTEQSVLDFFHRIPLWENLMLTYGAIWLLTFIGISITCMVQWMAENRRAKVYREDHVVPMSRGRRPCR